MIIIAETLSDGVQCQVRAELSCHCHLSYSRQLLPRNYPGSHSHQSQVRLIFQLLYFNYLIVSGIPGPTCTVECALMLLEWILSTAMLLPDPG